MVSLQTQQNEPLCPLGLAGNPDGGSGCVTDAVRAGINAFFFYNLSFKALIHEIKETATAQRASMFVATGTEDRDVAGVRAYFNEVQKALQLDTVDAFFAEYVAPGDSLDDVRRVLDEIHQWKMDGKVRYVGASVHDRSLALQLLQGGHIDVLMHRYNMAHRKSEDEVLPLAVKMGIPVVSFTNTRWGSLLKGHAKWQGSVPSAADCYRFVMRHPAVKLAWTAPSNVTELQANMACIDAPRMTGDEVAQWKTYGDLIYGDGTDAFEMRWP
ncbi:MAG: aldo/keto reductase [Candidatus Latescibacteria bacterium]|nr:aldo/keto reductase [Candidatus Latescibacterota bacterium]MBT4141042.1 aldo/keto reductase [Candidatus Latescibacterota bacterium]MBT5832593.1 aldo/keto reductase [Candidatus Latescibacterota bacterium]